MRNVLAIGRRELKAYFNSPIAYIYIIVFLLITSGLFMSTFFLIERADMRSYFSLLSLILAVFIPAITMRLLPEEKRQGTAELILTSPVTSAQIVLGKYLGALVVSLVMLGASLAFVGVLTFVSTPDLRVVASLYIGVFLLGAAFLAIGLCLSAFTDNQVLAYVLGVGALLVLWFLSGVSRSTSLAGTLGERGVRFLESLSIIEHFTDFSKGILDTQHVVYYLSVIFFSLFVAQRVVDSHRWR